MPMNKRLLKNLAMTLAGAGTVSGAGYVGHKIGFRSGARKMSDVMGSEFSQFNQEENKGIATSAYKKGIADTLSYLQKQSSLDVEKIAEDAFKNELEKLGVNPVSTGSAILGTAKGIAKNLIIGGHLVPSGKVLQGVKQSFSNLRSAGKHLHQAYKQEKIKPGSGIEQAGHFISNIKKSKTAIGFSGLGAYGAFKAGQKIVASPNQNYQPQY